MCLHVLHSYHTLSFFLFSHFKFFSFLCHSFHLPNLQNQTSSKPIFQKLWIGVSSKMIIFENKSYDGLMTHVETTPFMDICYLMWKSNDAYYQQQNMLESSVNSPLFPESNLYCAQLPLNLILHPNDNGNNSDLWFRWWLDP